MAKPITRIPRVTPERPMTEEEKRTKVLQYLQQKREQFSINILCNMIQGAITNSNATNLDCKGLVDLSVQMADALLDELYPLPKPQED